MTTNWSELVNQRVLVYMSPWALNSSDRIVTRYRTDGYVQFDNSTTWYDVNFIKTRIELSPFKLPLKSGALSSQDFIFEGLFGVFNDSLPDGWGRLLLDRTLVKLGMNPHNISPLERLVERAECASTEIANSSTSLDALKPLFILCDNKVLLVKDKILT